LRCLVIVLLICDVACMNACEDAVLVAASGDHLCIPFSDATPAQPEVLEK